MAQTRKYYLGKGKLKLYKKLASGIPGALFFFANAPKLTLSITVEKKEHTESYSGTNAVDSSVVIKSSAEIAVEIDELTADTFELISKGTKRTVASGSVVDFRLPATLANNDEYKLPGTGLTAITVKDSAATPVTVPAAKYSIDPKNGTITIIDKTGTTVTNGWTVSFTYAQVTVVTVLDGLEKDLYLTYEGKNLHDNTDVLLELPKSRFEPSNQTDFIGDDFAKFPVKAAVLPDEALTADANWDDLGNFGRLVFNPGNV